MREILEDQNTIRRYLLGDLEEEARDALENRLLGEAEFFEQIDDAENDLVDDYVGERLDARERKLLESYYLALPEKRAKVETATVLRRELQNAKTGIVQQPAVTAAATENSNNFWHSIREFFASLQIASVAAAVILLFVIGGLWFVFRPKGSDEIVALPTPHPTISNIQPSPTLAPSPNTSVSENTSKTLPQTNTNIQPNANAAPKETPRQIEPKPQTAPPVDSAPQTVTLALVTGIVRGGGSEANKLILPKTAQNVRLSFELKGKNYREIEARIETVAGANVWRGKINQSSGRVTLNLPAKLFADEDYLMIVSGVNETGERKDFTEFYFNAEKK